MVTATNYSISIASGTTQIVCGKFLPPVNIDIGTSWMFFGDSQTGGRATETSVVSPIVAFENIWNQTNTASITADAVSGVSGQRLYTMRGVYTGTTGIAAADYVHFQDSGSQADGGVLGSTLTATEFALVFVGMVNDILTGSPDAVICTETAYSFEELSDSGRWWDDHNTAMEAEIATFAGTGTTIYKAEVDRNITELIVQKRIELGTTAGQQAVFGDTGDVLGNHYTGLGNLMVALSMFEALGYTLGDLDLSDIPTGDVSAADKALCISVIEGF